MLLDELFDYKNKLMEELCKNENIVRMITNNDEAEVPSHNLPYTQIFPFEYVPETADDGKSYICFDVDIMRVPNRTIYLPVIYIWIYSHKSRLRLSKGGLLLDEVSKEIDKMLNGSRFYGMGELKLNSVRRFAPITDYLGRTLTYHTVDFNRPSGSRYRPDNRKIGV